MEKFDLPLYNDEFFEWHLKYARNYSIETMDWLIDKYNPKSVVDFGCGIGSYLESCYNKGLRKIKGYDIGGDYAKKYTPDYLHKFIEYTDCTKEIDTDKYECVMTFETIEHIEPSGTDTFIQNLIKSTEKNGYILFTGAPTEQDGCGHINCHDKAYWLEKFSKFDYHLDLQMNQDIKNGWKNLNVGCPNYILDNLIVLKNYE